MLEKSYNEDYQVGISNFFDFAIESFIKLILEKAKGIVVLSPAMKQVATNCPNVTDKISVIHTWANKVYFINL